jgi:hypothetical protein
MSPRRLALVLAFAAGAFTAVAHAACRLDIPASTADLVERNDAVLYQPSTGLEWKRCPQGMFAWTGGCYGTPQLATWADAHVAAAVDATDGGGWRLPNAKELRALVEDRCTGPALDPVRFAGAPGGLHWTSTGTAEGLAAFVVDLGDGLRSDAPVPAWTPLSTRLVRGGRVGAAFRAAWDASPDGLAFPDRYWALPGEVVVSQPVTLYGLGQRVVAALDGCTSAACDFSVNDGPFSAEPRDVGNGDTIELRLQAGATAGAGVQVVLQVGMASAAWRAYTTGQVVIATPSPLPARTQGTWSSLLLDAANGTPPVTFALAGGALPTGMMLDPNGFLHGTPSAAGSFTFTVHATDAATPPTAATRTFTMTVNPPLVIVTTALPDATAGWFYDQQIATQGGTPPLAFSLHSCCLPPGIGLGSTGHVMGWPQQVGDFAFTVEVRDTASASVTRPFALRVRAQAMMVSGSSAPSVPAGTGFALTASLSVVPALASPAGTVAFRHEASALPGCEAVPVVASGPYGTATCNVAALPVGVYALTAAYSGATYVLPATSSITQVVTAIPGTPCTGFTDVDAADVFCPSVEWMRNRSITTGCTATEYCPGATVSRLGMAAFMTRVGDVLEGEPETTGGVLGALPPGVAVIGCPSAPVPALPYPTRVEIDAVYSGLGTTTGTLRIRLLESADGVAWTPAGPFHLVSVASGRWTALRVIGSRDVEAGRSVRFAVNVNNAPGGPPVSDGTCRLRLRTGNRNTTWSPFDVSR